MRIVRIKVDELAELVLREGVVTADDRYKAVVKCSGGAGEVRGELLARRGIHGMNRAAKSESIVLRQRA